MAECLDLGEVTREMIARYAEAIGDFNPVHLDEDFAKGAGLPSVIAHGPLTGALFIDAVLRSGRRSRTTGFDLRLKEPVFPGDKLAATRTGDGSFEITDSQGRVKATVILREAQ